MLSFHIFSASSSSLFIFSNISSKWAWKENDKHTFPKNAIIETDSWIESTLETKPSTQTYGVVVMMTMMAMWSWYQCYSEKNFLFYIALDQINYHGWWQSLNFSFRNAHYLLIKALRTNKTIQPLNQQFLKQIRGNTVLVLYATQAVSNHMVTVQSVSCIWIWELRMLDSCNWPWQIPSTPRNNVLYKPQVNRIIEWSY